MKLSTFSATDRHTRVGRPAHYMSRSAVMVWLLAAATAVGLQSCGVTKYIADDELYLKEVKVESTDRAATKDFLLDGYVRQTPNQKWFGAKIPMRIYCLSSPESNSWVSRTLRKMGQKPEIYDSLMTLRSVQDIRQVLANAGYMHSEVDVLKKVEGRKLSLTYRVNPHEQYQVMQLRRVVEDPRLRQIICGQDTLQSLLRIGMSLDINTLNAERTRLTTLLRDIGFFKFNKEYIHFDADTIRGSNEAVLTMHVAQHLENGSSEPENHPQLRIGHITYHVDVAASDTASGSIEHKGTTIRYGNRLHFRPNLLTSNTMMRTGTLYSERYQRMTYNNFMRLHAIASTNIRLTQRPGTDSLDCDITLNHARPRSVSFDLEGTNSAGDLGAAASATYQHKNLFRGSETLTLKLRGAYEAITGLEGYEGHNYTELGAEARIGFPGFLLPFVKREYGATHFATSEISLQYNWQNRPEFHRRVLTAAWRYRWQSYTQKVQHRFDLLEVNYIYMPWVSRQFHEQYLDVVGKQNAILRYNYENLLITKLGYTYTFNSLGTSVTNTYGQNAYTFRLNVETSGNLLEAATKSVRGKQNSMGQYTFCGIAFAQYLRGDIDFAKSVRIDRNNSVAFHAAIGIAYPYGNSNQLPFEKRYFAGGANSVRGWSVRSLGPGAYKGADRQINFLNQSGDIKLDLNIELRSHLFWKLNGALFIDAGNIWTIRKYEDQPEGEFRFDSFYRQIAVSYGLGLRLALDFFTIRFDAGMKAINPAYEGRDHYPIWHPNLSRDFAFHFAVGLPF